MKLTRSNSDKWVAGVAGGIAEATGLDSTVVRIVLAILCVVAGSGVVIYCLLWAIMPRPEGGSLAEDGLREVRAWYRNREHQS
ncbi:MAG: PspC domain-containing protein [Propionibacteriaceae bacterium]|nr:PspC domain-containing protein [Propionibacteriaceae bacterium]